MKPAFGGGWKNVHKIRSIEEAVWAYKTSGQLTMMLQESIEWEGYIRCIAIGRKYTRPCRYSASGRHGRIRPDSSVVKPGVGEDRGRVLHPLLRSHRLRHERTGVGGTRW